MLSVKSLLIYNSRILIMLTCVANTQFVLGDEVEINVQSTLIKTAAFVSEPIAIKINFAVGYYMQIA